MYRQYTRLCGCLNCIAYVCEYIMRIMCKIVSPVSVCFCLVAVVVVVRAVEMFFVCLFVVVVVFCFSFQFSLFVRLFIIIRFSPPSTQGSGSPCRRNQASGGGFKPAKSQCSPFSHTPSITFRHLPPNSARIGYATEEALFISAQLSTDTVSALRMVWVLIRLEATQRPSEFRSCVNVEVAVLGSPS